MKRYLTSILAATACTLIALTSAAEGQTYPTRPVELIVSFQPGGGVDTMARLLAEAGRSIFPHPLVVVNKPGASGGIGLGYVASAPADGYKVAMVFAELLTLPLLGQPKVSYEAFEPIAKFTSDPSTVTVRADAPWNTLDEFLRHARSNPNKVTISNAGNGSISHISGSALGAKVGASFSHVPYQGSGPAVQALLGGQVDATAVNYSVVSPHGTGKLKILATMSEKRLTDKVPTLRELGIDLSLDAWRGIAVPRGTPKEAVDELGRLAALAAKDPKMLESLRKQNQTLDFENAEQFRRTLRQQDAMFKQLIPSLGIKN